MSDRDLAAAVGVAGVLAGLAGIAGFAIPGLNASFVFVALVGALAGVQGLRYALHRRDVDPVATETGDPERRHRVPAPGDELDRGASAARGLGRRGRGRDRLGSRRSGRRNRTRRRVEGWPRRRPRTLRRRVRAAVVETIRLREYCSAEAAERLVESGEWTDDPVAARFLGADVRIPLPTRLKLRITRRNAYRSRAERTLDALDELVMGDEAALTDGAPAEGGERAYAVARADDEGGRRHNDERERGSGDGRQRALEDERARAARNRRGTEDRRGSER